MVRAYMRGTLRRFVPVSSFPCAFCFTALGKELEGCEYTLILLDTGIE